MSTPAIGQTAASTSTPHSLPNGTKNIGQDAFLKLLVAQLQNQDPTKPQDNGEFIAQLATFSSLEKLTEISTKLDALGQLLTVPQPAGDSPDNGGQ